jgi:threonine/homoserine/homoserine lactone efflux protein
VIVVYLVQGLGYGFAAAVQPGPFQTFVLSQVLKRGWRRALPVALAPLISDGPIIALMLLVLSRLAAWLEKALHVAGGLFILYLAWGAYRSWRSYGIKIAATPGAQSMFQAAAMNALSPGPYVYWGTVTGPMLIRGWRERPANGIVFLVGFYLAMVGALAGMIVLLGTARQLGPRVNRVLLGASAIVLACFGTYQLWLGLSAIFT